MVKTPIMKQKRTFSLVSNTDVKKNLFFNVKLKLPTNIFFIFLSFMKKFSKGTVRRCYSK